MTLFNASRADAEQMDDLNTFVVAVAENPDGTGNRLEFQRALSIEPEDVDLGMDTYCLCTSEGASHYGGVVTWSASSDCLTVMLDQVAAKALNLPMELKVGLRLTEEAVLRLRAGLRRVIDGVDA